MSSDRANEKFCSGVVNKVSRVSPWVVGSVYRVIESGQYGEDVCFGLLIVVMK